MDGLADHFAASKGCRHRLGSWQTLLLAGSLLCHNMQRRRCSRMLSRQGMCCTACTHAGRARGRVATPIQPRSAASLQNLQPRLPLLRQGPILWQQAHPAGGRTPPEHLHIKEFKGREPRRFDMKCGGAVPQMGIVQQWSGGHSRMVAQIVHWMVLLNL